MVKLGVAPIGKFVFSHADALVQKRLVEERLRAWKVPFVNVDGALKDGMVRSQADVGPAVASLREQGAEALFLPHCNFWTEGAAGMIARTLGLQHRGPAGNVDPV